MKDSAIYQAKANELLARMEEGPRLLNNLINFRDRYLELYEYVLANVAPDGNTVFSETDIEEILAGADQLITGIQEFANSLELPTP